jgi:hypothetical protein
MKGYGVLALPCTVTVIFTLLWLPFGKFFHIFQRPAQLGVNFCQDIGAREGMAGAAAATIAPPSNRYAGKNGIKSVSRG